MISGMRICFGAMVAPIQPGRILLARDIASDKVRTTSAFTPGRAAWYRMRADKQVGAPDTHAILYCLQAEQYCCPIQKDIDLSSGINTTCCSSSDLVFQAADPMVYTIASLDFVATASRRSTTTAVSSADTLTTTTQVSTTTSSTQPSQSSSTSSSPPPSSSSSSDSKIGIYVGVPLGVVLLIALGIIAWLLVRKRKKAAAGAAYQYPPVHPPVPWQGPEKFAHVAEAGAQGHTSELPAGQEVAAELYADRRQQ